VGLGRARGCPESPPRGGERFGRRGESRASAPPWSAARSCAPLERGSRRPRRSEPRDARGCRTSVLAHDLKSPPPTDIGWDGRNAPPSSRARTTSRRTPRRAAGPPWSGRGGSDDGGASCFTSGWDSGTGKQPCAIAAATRSVARHTGRLPSSAFQPADDGVGLPGGCPRSA